MSLVLHCISIPLYTALVQNTLVERLLEERKRCRTGSLAETLRDVPSLMLVVACNSTLEANSEESNVHK